MKQVLRSTAVPTFITVGIIVFGWLCLFGWSIAATIYRDHQNLVASNSRLKEENRILKPASSAASKPMPLGAVPITPKSHPKQSPISSEAVRSVQSATGQNSAAVGSITLSPGSVAQVGGTGNTAIVEGTKDWLLTRDEQINLQNALAKSHGRVRMGWWVEEPRCVRYAEGLVYAFKEAGWKIENPPPNYAGAICWPNPDWDCLGLEIVVRNRLSDSARTAIAALSALVPHLYVAVSEKNDEDLIEVFVSKAPQ